MNKIFLLCSVVFVSQTLFAEQGNYMNLTGGAVFPSINGAMYTNPAGLGAYPTNAVELDVNDNTLTSTPQSGAITYVHRFSASQNTGYGLGAIGGAGAPPQLTAAIGYAPSQFFSAGVSTTFATNNDSLSADVGVRLGGQNTPTVALVLHNLWPSPQSYVLGLGVNIEERVFPEIDFNVTPKFGSLMPQSVDSVISLTVVARGKAALQLGWLATIFPNRYFDNPFFVGLAINLGQKVVFIAHINPGFSITQSAYNFALKFII